MAQLSRTICAAQLQLGRTRNLLLQVQQPLEILYCCECNSSGEGIKDRQIPTYKYVTHAALAFGAAVATWVGYNYAREKYRHLQASSPAVNSIQGEFIDGLPVYNLEEVSAHDNKKTGIWVTYGQGVYDITDFVDKHPGGNEKILMAAGGSLEPFWMLYAVHKNPDILQVLDKYRIGNLSKEDASHFIANMEDPYSNEPRRHPTLRPGSVKPFNAETPLSLLADSFITPSVIFYVRNHLPVPTVDVKSYELEISGVGMKTKTLSLEDIKKKFPKHTITSTIQCAGNRRSEMNAVKPVKGLSWDAGAIGNATWSGARLRDVLMSAGLKDMGEAEHVQFEGLDTDSANTPYGASIPIEKALDPKGDVILAYEMNGEPLSRDHGFPIRVVVPGVVGARCVKWLGKITVSTSESMSHWQQNDYKGFSPSVDWDTVDFSTSPAIQELPVVSAICDPAVNSTVHLCDGKLNVRGYAWSGGGRKIVRVDVTVDGGKSWHVSRVTDQDKAKSPHHWGWTLWKAEIPVPPETKQVEIWAKAVDSSYNVQPEHSENIWNLRGVLNNAYHRIKVNIK